MRGQAERDQTRVSAGCSLKDREQRNSHISDVEADIIEEVEQNWKRQQGLPWRLSGEEPTCQCRRHGFSPSSRKISHTAGQLSACTTATEPVLGGQELQLRKPTRLEPPLCSKGSPLSETPVHHNWRVAPVLSTALEKSPHSNGDPAQPNRNNNTVFQKENKTLKLLEEKKLESSQPQLLVRQRLITWQEVRYVLVFYCCCNKLPQYKTFKQAKFIILQFP